jgi:hypothetical protein
VIDTALVQMKINDLPDDLPEAAGSEDDATSAPTETSVETETASDEEAGE